MVLAAEGPTLKQEMQRLSDKALLLREGSLKGVAVHTLSIVLGTIVYNALH